MLTVVLITVCACGLVVADSGPHLTNDWGESVRLRHLYAARPGLHLQISQDGKIGGSHIQSSYSLVEIRTIATGYVVIKGVASSRYLCMESNGRLYGSHSYMKEDCSFHEQILPDGYNIYTSGKHGILVSLGGKNRRQNALSQFLPMLNMLPQEHTNYNLREVHSPIDPEQDLPLGVQEDSMESFGTIAQIVIQSPSFNKR